LLGGTQLAVFAAAVEEEPSVAWTIGVVGLLVGVVAIGSAFVVSHVPGPSRPEGD
jgi:hypothetical protein